MYDPRSGDPRSGDPRSREPRAGDPRPGRPARRIVPFFLAGSLSVLSCLSWVACDRGTSSPSRKDDRADQVEADKSGLVGPETQAEALTLPPLAKMQRPRAKKVPIPDPTPDESRDTSPEASVYFDAPFPDAPVDGDRSSLPRISETLTVSADETTIKGEVEADSLSLEEPELPAVDDLSFPDPASEPQPAGPADLYSQIGDGQIGGALEGKAKPQNRSFQGGSSDLRSADKRIARLDETRPQTPVPLGPPETRARSRARAWLTDRQRIEGLTFQEARGYWANTYLPGDPGLRFLQARLSAQTAVDPELGRPGTQPPHALSRRPRPPFDPPSHAALGLHLHADQSALEGRSRLLLQVGLQATERFGGRRTAMNLAVVLSLPALATHGGPDDSRPENLPAQDLEALRQLLFAFAEQRDFEDRFRLWVVGRSGGLVLSAKDFRHGPLAVLCEQLARGEELPGPTLDPTQVLTMALEDLAATDDPSAPLGSSGLVWIETTPQTGSPALEAQIHSAAVAGLPTTTFGIGRKVRSDTLESWALIGQGRHYKAVRADRAELQVQQELEAAARTVARAVRLNIRLAPGVELVDVLGSHPLDELDAGRVKAVEHSVDLRLARRLGITADRGDDDDGIQIVVPSFYAGDYHTILLDVVAEPGPIAEVTAKFKDLVHLDNGVARAHLTLERGEPRFGAYQRAVLLDHLAHELQTALRSAGDAWSRGRTAEVHNTLSRARDLLTGLAVERPELLGHPILEEDSHMIERFITWIPRSPQWLDESLRYAGWLKAQPAPELPES